MGLADRASAISDAIVEFLAEGGTASELRDIMTAWAVAVGMIGVIPIEDEE